MPKAVATGMEGFAGITRALLQRLRRERVRVWGLGFRFWGLGFRVWGFGLRVWGVGFRGVLA